MAKIISCETLEVYINDRIKSFRTLGGSGEVLICKFTEILNYVKQVRNEECGIFMAYDYILDLFKKSKIQDINYSVNLYNKQLSCQLQKVLDWMNE